MPLPPKINNKDKQYAILKGTKEEITDTLLVVMNPPQGKREIKGFFRDSDGLYNILVEMKMK